MGGPVRDVACGVWGIVGDALAGRDITARPNRSVIDTREEGEGMLDTLMTRIRDMQANAAVKAVFGEPVEVRGRTVVPVAEVRYGFGVGMGRGGHHEREADKDDAAGPRGEGGGGGGASIRPLAVLEITDRETKVTPVVDVTRIALAGIGLAAWAVFWISRAVRARERRER